MKTIQEKISIMQAYADGSKIEVKNIMIDDDPYGRADFPTWDWAKFDYRVVSKSPRRIWLLDTREENPTNVEFIEVLK